MSRRTAEAARALAAHFGSLPLLAEKLAALVGDAFSAEASLLAGAAEAEPVVWVRAPDARGLALGVDGVFAGALAARVLGQPPIAEAEAPRDPTPVERGIVCYLAAALVEGRGLTASLSAALPPADALTIEIRCTVGNVRGTAHVWVPVDFARAPSVASGPPARLAAVPIPAVVSRGHVRLTSDEIASLRPRDVVVLSGEAEVRVARGALACRIERSGACILRPYERGVPMNEALARDLPVELVCEIGRVQLSAKEVLELAPGAVVTLPDKVGALVALTAGGRVVAMGELLDVEGQVGVRIVETT